MELIILLPLDGNLLYLILKFTSVVTLSAACDPTGNTPVILESPEPPSGNPCVPSPCGPNSQCRAVGSTPACTCLPNYVGRAPNCRPECTINAECPSNLACQKESCRDPCPGSCGPRAICHVVNHGPVCTCLPGLTGDPFSGCSPVPASKIPCLRPKPLSAYKFTRCRRYILTCVLLNMVPLLLDISEKYWSLSSLTENYIYSLFALRDAVYTGFGVLNKYHIRFQLSCLN